MATQESQRIQIDCTPARNGRTKVRVRYGEQLIHSDTFDIDSSKSRQGFLNAAERRASSQNIEFDRNRCEQILLNHSAQEADDRYCSNSCTDYSEVLTTFGIEVLAENEDQSILCWIPGTGKRWTMRSPSNWKEEEMLQALGAGAAQRLWREKREPPRDGTFTPEQLREAVAIAAAEAPRGSANQQVGQGVWPHGEQLLIVNGAECHTYDGESCEPVDHPRLGNKIIDFNAGKAWYPSDLVAAVEAMGPEQARDAFNALRDILRNWNWSHELDPDLIAALIPATFIQAVWQWRPLVSIIGASDSGKSTLLQDVLQPVFGEWCIAADRSTEAGLRQAIGHDSAPVVIDEFDKYKQRQSVLELFRTASRGGTVLRGTQNQSGQSFGVKHLAWFAAIESGDVWGQDRNRFIRPELRAPKNRGSLDIPGHTELRELGQRLAAAAIWAAPAAVALAGAIKNERIEGVHGRLVESFAVPAAMAAVLLHGRDAEEEVAREMLRQMIAGRSVLQEQGESNETQLINDIMSTVIRVVQSSDDDKPIYVERSVGQLLNPYRRTGGRTPLEDINKEGMKVLEAKGIKLIGRAVDNSSKLFFAHSIVRESLLGKTRWADTSIDQLMARLPGAQREQQRVGGNKVSGISLPWPGCLDGLGGEDTEEDTESVAG